MKRSSSSSAGFPENCVRRSRGGRLPSSPPKSYGPTQRSGGVIVPTRFDSAHGRYVGVDFACFAAGRGPGSVRAGVEHELAPHLHLLVTTASSGRMDVPAPGIPQDRISRRRSGGRCLRVVLSITASPCSNH